MSDFADRLVAAVLECDDAPTSFIDEKKAAVAVRALLLTAGGEHERVLRNVIAEADFVLSGGDDEHDRCTECGLAGVGMLRDALTQAATLLGLDRSRVLHHRKTYRKLAIEQLRDAVDRAIAWLVLDEVPGESKWRERRAALLDVMEKTK